MQQPWFQVFADLPGHTKIGKLRDGLKLKNRYEAVGLIVCIWSWAAVHAPSGELTGVSAQDLADAAGWRKSAKGLLEALVAAGFLDRDGDGGLALHDWDGHQCMLQDAMTRSRRKAADRQKAYRDRKRAEREAAERPSPVPEDDEPRNVTHNVTGNITDRHSNGTTSSSTITNTLPISQSVAVVNTVPGDDGDGGDGDRDVLRLIGGEIGQGVLLLSDRQMDDLLSRLGVDGFNAYAKRLVSWVQRKHANVDHYREILKWATADGVLTSGPDLLWAGRAGT